MGGGERKVIHKEINTSKEIAYMKGERQRWGGREEACGRDKRIVC